MRASELGKRSESRRKRLTKKKRTVTDRRMKERMMLKVSRREEQLRAQTGEGGMQTKIWSALDRRTG